MVIDFHTHIFPPEVAADRGRFLDTDTVFRELYESPKAKLVSAGDLLTSMDEGGVDVSVALGFAWSSAAHCRMHNDYIIEAANRSSGRIIPFCTLPLAAGILAVETELARCVSLGVPGFGELRPDNLGFDLASEAGRRLGRLATETGAMLLFHCTEPAGHPYAGKQGMRIESLYEFIVEHPGARIVAAHWGGGLPFYTLMPEVKPAFRNVVFDTAATSLLYGSGIYAHVAQLTGAARIVFGSDYPLLSQKRSRERIEASGLTAPEVDAVLGGNAARLLYLPNTPAS